MKPFDFVRPRREFLEKRYHGGGCRLRFIADSGKPERTITNEDRIKAVGIITETCGESANVEWIGDNYGLYSAWWGAGELEVIDNLPRIIANAMAHPFGDNKEQGDEFFPIEEFKEETKEEQT